MFNNLVIFFDILKFSKGPQDLPTDSNLLNSVILINILISLIPSDPAIQFSYGHQILLSLVYIGVTLLFVQLSLNIKDKASDTVDQYKVRYLQVGTAILGIHAIVGFLTTLISIIADYDKNLIVLLIMVVTIYTWLINGFIFKHALDKSMVFGLGVSFIYSMIAGSVMLIVLQILV